MDKPQKADLPVVLVVDDEPQLAECMLYYVEEAGMTGITAGNGVEAVALIRDQHIDLVVTDIRMPEMDGMGLLKWVKAHKPETPVILYSAYADFDRQGAIALGAADLFDKPVDGDRFVDLLPQLATGKKAKS